MKVCRVECPKKCWIAVEWPLYFVDIIRVSVLHRQLSQLLLCAENGPFELDKALDFRSFIIVLYYFKMSHALIKGSQKATTMFGGTFWGIFYEFARGSFTVKPGYALHNLAVFREIVHKSGDSTTESDVFDHGVRHIIMSSALFTMLGAPRFIWAR